MKIGFFLSALAPIVLAGCAEEPTAVTTTTTETTRQVTTTAPVTTREVVTQPVTREVLVTQGPPPVRVETRTVSPGATYVWTGGYWGWTRADYVWGPGTWVRRPRPAAVL